MNNPMIRTFHDPDRHWTLNEGDVLDILPTLSANLYDGVLSDPPYGIDFMNQGWDSEVPPVPVWKSLLRLCKPGAFLLAFGGPKTFHRLFCNVEDAGWELRDTICWLYGEGFPKGHNISKAIGKRPGAEQSAKLWDGYSTALKPAWEPILVAQKPRRGTYADNAMQYGCGGLNVDGCRIGTNGGTKRSGQSDYPRLSDGREDRSHWARSGHLVEVLQKGRYPANLILDEDAAMELDRQYGHSRSARGKRRRANSNVGNGITLGKFRSRTDEIVGYDDEGGASRFFYVSKAGHKERAGNGHPTIKPLALCEYLSRLILPPQRKTPRRLLVPFSGSGSEMIGAMRAGWDHVTGIERDAQFAGTARRRLCEFVRGTTMTA